MKFIFLSVGKTKKRLSRGVVLWILVFVYMMVIFALSNQRGLESNRISKELVEGIKSHIYLPTSLQTGYKTYGIDYNYIVRKAAHFTEYFLLAGLLYAALANWGLSMKGRFIISFLLCVSYASLDEFHQWFVPGRSSRIKDIWIDSSGAVLALSLACSKERFGRGKRRKGIT